MLKVNDENDLIYANLLKITHKDISLMLITSLGCFIINYNHILLIIF